MASEPGLLPPSSQRTSGSGGVSSLGFSISPPVPSFLAAEAKSLRSAAEEGGLPSSADLRSLTWNPGSQGNVAY